MPRSSVASCHSLAPVHITLVKAQGGGAPEQDRVYVEVDGETRRVAVHVVHDLPHLVVESFFGIADGLWGELTAGLHTDANFAATARDTRRQKQGRIVSGQASGARTDEWLSDGHRMAKTVTNAVVNRWGEGPDSPAGVRSRLIREDSEPIRELLARVDDETIAAAIEAVAALRRRWESTPPGGSIRLTWPLDRSSPS